MAERKYRFKGHESFILREGWLSKGLSALEKNKKVFFENSGADELGVGVNMAKSIRYWLRCAGLSKESKGCIALSNLGKIILEKDPYLENIFSLWLIHCNIAKNKKEATTWNLFFQEFDSMEFSTEYLKKEMLQIVESLPELDKFSERSVTEDCDALLRMYTREKEKGKTPEEKNVSPFAVLGLIRNRNGIYVKEQPALNKIPEELIFYLIAQTEGSSESTKTSEEKAVVSKGVSNMVEEKAVVSKGVSNIAEEKAVVSKGVSNIAEEKADVSKGVSNITEEKADISNQASDTEEVMYAISIDDLLEGINSPGKVLNLKRSGLLELLERLAAKNMIQINRTAGLDMVYWAKINETDLIENCYKRLAGEYK